MRGALIPVAAVCFFQMRVSALLDKTIKEIYGVFVTLGC
jgi:hypothetical protein